MTGPPTHRWLQTRVPGRLGVVLAVVTAIVAGIPLFVFLTAGPVWCLIVAIVIFGLAGWTFAAAVTKLRTERSHRP